jgi:hypothetical protein
MKRNAGGVNGWTFNPQLIVKVSVFSPLPSLINQSSGSCGTAMMFDSHRDAEAA